MASPSTTGPLRWTLGVPLLAFVVLVSTWAAHEHWAVLGLIAIFLVGAVIAAVHHAEVVAHKVGEPFGSLVLAVAVTVIEVALIVTLMSSGGEDTSTYARDTVFAAVMICLNGIVGLALVVGAARHRLASFNASGTGSALATVITLASITMVLPRFTTSAPDGAFSTSQLAFAAVASLFLYGLFVFTQTVKHRNFFLPVRSDEFGRMTGLMDLEDEDGDGYADPPTARAAWLSAVLLVVSLVAVVGLAKLLSPSIESGVESLGFPQAVVGVVIALLVLSPETVAAARNAHRDRTQISLNLAYGSAMASIGLTIPTIAVAMIWIDGPLNLGLEPTQIVLLAMSVIVSILTVVSGRAKTLHGGLHLALLAAFLFISVQP
jgi:Ca2+:H+ antiporter